ncbi:hypothetical protein HD806DRAFT_549415 [Xylariaceae sp. AK1471]|nr:hypothetical protein HD806DRAFT_549415 [Xylariaceae sp. AK1471]
MPPLSILPSTSYIPRVRGGRLNALEGSDAQQLTHTPMEARRGTTWVQTLSEIPYEDVISAHSVKSFVPLILIRELLPLMCNGEASGRQAYGYIINVSSREDIFERIMSGKTSAKNSRHVHTNMSKAALNMITETEAVTAWKKVRVAMNTIDPGYMSAALEFESIGVRPIGWEDGAGRVMWPIAVGELAKKGEDGFDGFGDGS